MSESTKEVIEGLLTEAEALLPAASNTDGSTPSVKERIGLDALRAGLVAAHLSLLTYPFVYTAIQVLLIAIAARYGIKIIY